MLRQLLVPLDRSALSERALPYASLIAQAQGAAVTLVRVLDIENFTWPHVDDAGHALPAKYDPAIEAIRAEAHDHLRTLRDELRAIGLTTEAELLGGSAASILVDREATLAPDLCIMATHGRSGIARFALGSVADRLVREGSAPVLLIPAFGATVPRLARGLVPLDGSPLAEQALPLVEALAGKPLSSVRLLLALGDRTLRLANQPEQVVTAAAAAEYLHGVAARLERAGLTVEVAVAANHAVEAIEAAAGDVDVVIMSTHGRGGVDRWRHGSVAERATRHVAIPRLLVRAH